MSIDLARKRATKFFQFHKLSLPVNVKDLLSSYARVEEAFIPSDGDAICINRDQKPYIIIKENISPTRKRFTYAHELGHIQIPSHTGMISCNTEAFDVINESQYMALEQEANAFAAELLMPTDWIESLLHDNNSEIKDIIDHVCINAEVSFSAALYSVVRCAPENFLFFIENKIDSITVIKHGSKSYRPLLFTKESEGYDLDWITSNCITLESFENEMFQVTVFKFKNLVEENCLVNMKPSFVEKTSCKNLCDQIVSWKHISHAHFFKALKEYLPDGVVLKIKSIACDLHEYIYAPNTYIRPKLYEEESLYDFYTSKATFHIKSTGSSIELDVWYLKTTFDFNRKLSQGEDSKTILKTIVSETIVNKADRRSVFGIVNGIFGSLNNSKGNYTEKEFYCILRQKFVARPDIKLITNHKDFDGYLVSKTLELFNR